jgi:hypothetical protein
VLVTGDDAGLTQLARLRIVFPSVVAIALLLLLFQQGFGFFNLSAKFSERVPNNIRRIFYLCPQMLYLALFVLFSSARASAERRNDSVSATRLS